MRHCKPLAFAAGQQSAAFADARLEGVRPVFDEVERLGAGGGFTQLRFGSVGFADAQVFGDGAVEQKRLLKHDANVAAQPSQREPADIHAVDLDQSRLRIEGAVQKRERGRLAAAGRPDQRNAFARQCRKA